MVILRQVEIACLFISIVSSPCIHGCKRKQADKQDKDVCAFNGAPVPVQICSTEPYCM